MTLTSDIRFVKIVRVKLTLDNKSRISVNLQIPKSLLNIFIIMTFQCLFQDDIEKSGRYEFYCGPDDADYVSPVAFCVQVRVGRGFDKLGQTCLKQQHVY